MKVIGSEGGVSFEGGEDVLKSTVVCDDGCTILNILSLLNCTL